MIKEQISVPATLACCSAAARCITGRFDIAFQSTAAGQFLCCDGKHAKSVMPLTLYQSFAACRRLYLYRRWEQNVRSSAAALWHLESKSALLATSCHIDTVVQCHYPNHICTQQLSHSCCPNATEGLLERQGSAGVSKEILTKSCHPNSACRASTVYSSIPHPRKVTH